MNRKDQAIVKAKIDNMHIMYIEAAKKNHKLKDMVIKFGDISVAFDRVCAALNYYHQAALERDIFAMVTDAENERLKEQVSQQKEAIEKLNERVAELLKEYEV